MIRVLWFAVCCALLAACQRGELPVSTRSLAGNGAPGAPREAAAELESGRRIYNFRCYYCHGYSGDARTLAASFLFPQPRDFTSSEAAQLTREAMIDVIRNGRKGTAMAAFSSTLTKREIAAVTDFIRDEFTRKKAVNTRYHTPENGWANHERYRSAYPFATGEIALDTPTDNLTPEQAAGRRLFMTTCVSCHDRGRINEDGVTWELRAVSYPPNADACVGCHRYSAALRGEAAPPHTRADAINARYAVPGGPFERHDVAPRLADLDARERRGERLFQRNCTFCHAADGSGKNWIGAFLEPHPRDLRDPRFMSRMSRQKLAGAIRDGLPGTSMPAWKSVLADDEIEAVVAYLARAFGPVGN